VISEDGGSIRGSFIQSGYTMPFTLSRAGAAQIEPPVGTFIQGTTVLPLTFRRAPGVESAK